MILNIVGGEKYILAEDTFKKLIPVCFFAFLSMLHGWPCLGAIEKNTEVTKGTVISVLFNVIVMIILSVINTFTLQTLAILRVCTEIILFVVRYFYCIKYKGLFNGGSLYES